MAALYCLSVINNGGNILAGFSPDGAGGWGHFEASIAAAQPTPGFVEIEGLATSRSPSVAGSWRDGRQMVMSFLGHSDNNIYFASSADGTTWTERRLTGFTSNNPPAIFIMPSQPNLMLAFTAAESNQIVVATSDDDGATWSEAAIAQTARSAPVITYTANVIGGSWSQTNFYFVMLFQANDSSNRILSCTSFDGVNWQQAPDTGQQSPFAPSITEGLQSGGTYFTMAFVANDSSNQIMLSTAQGGLGWGTAVGTGHHCRGTPQLVNISNVFYLVFLGLGDDNIYCCRSADGINWVEHLVCPGLWPPGATNFSGVPNPSLQLPTPVTYQGGLGDRNNYYFTDGGRPLRNVRVDIVVDEDILLPPYTKEGWGVSFQVNCFSPLNTPQSKRDYAVSWQQYDTHISPDQDSADPDGNVQLYFRIFTWWQTPPPGTGATSDWLARLTSPKIPLQSLVFPKGSRIITTLLCDANDNVVGATFEAYKPDRTPYGPVWTQPLIGQKTSQGTEITEQEVAPILAFHLNFVADGGKVTIAGGAGTITYSAWNLMTANGSRPAGLSGYTTGESATNSTYGTLDNEASTRFTQTFGVS
jgi:hypothetical protein